MNVASEQMLAVAVLGAAAAAGLGIMLVLALLLRGLWRWALGNGLSKSSNQPQAGGLPAPLLNPLAASDLLAIRSNLDAVSRQIEDLEKKLRRAPPPRTRAAATRPLPANPPVECPLAEQPQ